MYYTYYTIGLVKLKTPYYNKGRLKWYKASLI